MAALAAAGAVGAERADRGDAARRTAGAAWDAAASRGARKARGRAGVDRGLPGLRRAARRVRAPRRGAAGGARAVPATRLHLFGADSLAAREAAIAAFQEPTGRSSSCARPGSPAQGITLTRASNVCFLELEWTPAMHDQAEDRCHRIGQRDAVTAWYLLAADTIDETMARLIQRKRGSSPPSPTARGVDGDGLVEASSASCATGGRSGICARSAPPADRPSGGDRRPGQAAILRSSARGYRVPSAGLLSSCWRMFSRLVRSDVSNDCPFRSPATEQTRFPSRFPGPDSAVTSSTT